MSNVPNVSENYDAVRSEIIELLQAARRVAARNINSLMTVEMEYSDKRSDPVGPEHTQPDHGLLWPVRHRALGSSLKATGAGHRHAGSDSEEPSGNQPADFPGDYKRPSRTPRNARRTGPLRLGLKPRDLPRRGLLTKKDEGRKEGPKILFGWEGLMASISP